MGFRRSVVRIHSPRPTNKSFAAAMPLPWAMLRPRTTDLQGVADGGAERNRRRRRKPPSDDAGVASEASATRSLRRSVVRSTRPDQIPPPPRVRSGRGFRRLKVYEAHQIGLGRFITHGASNGALKVASLQQRRGLTWPRHLPRWNPSPADGKQLSGVGLEGLREPRRAAAQAGPVAFSSRKRSANTWLPTGERTADHPR